MTTTSTEFLSDSPAATEAFAAQWAQTLQPDTAVLLVGDLGAGKTTFVRGLARGLGITDPIRSPTFTLIHEYTIQQPAPLKGLPFFHLDLYRLETSKQLATLGLDEIFQRDGIVAIEWAERLTQWNATLSVQQAWQIRLTLNGEQSRLIHIVKFATD